MKHLTIFLTIQSLWFATPSSSYSVEPSKVQDTAPSFKGVNGPSYPLVQDSYFTDDFGNILMTINVLGQVYRPGQVIIQEDADLGTLLTMTGGVTQYGNPKKIIVIRKSPDPDGTQFYKVNFKKFLKNGDRSSFVVLKPNDTVIIPEDNGISLATISQLMSLLSGGFNSYYILKQIGKF